jgi:hypothetical protein
MIEKKDGEKHLVDTLWYPLLPHPWVNITIYASELLGYLHGVKGIGVGVPSPGGTVYFIPVLHRAPDGQERVQLVSDMDPRLPEYPDPVQNRTSYLRLFPNNSILYDDAASLETELSRRKFSLFDTFVDSPYTYPPPGPPPRRFQNQKMDMIRPADVNGTPPGTALSGHGAPSIAPTGSQPTNRQIGPAVGPLPSTGLDPGKEGLSTSGAFIIRPINALGTALGCVMGVVFTLWLL